MTLPVLDHLEAVLYGIDGVTRLWWLPHARNIAWTEELSKPGWGSFEVPLDDGTTAAITFKRIVRLTWYRDGVPVADFAVRIESSAVQFAVDGREWLRFEQQPGALSVLGDAVVYPEYGLRRLAPATRLFGFMSQDGPWRIPAAWVTPRGYPFADEISRKGSPPELKTSGAWWIALASPAADVPVGTVLYFRSTLTLTGDQTSVIFEFTGDNYLTLYLNGEEIMTPDLGTGYGWRTVATVSRPLAAGDYLIAAKVENAEYHGTDTTRQNPIGFIGAVWETDSSGRKTSTLLTTNTTDWQVCDDTPEPGWRRASVLRQLVGEAHDRYVSAVRRVNLGFDDARDTDGVPWADRGEYALDVGKVSLLDVADQLTESSMDVGMDPTSFTLNAWARRGADLSGTVALVRGAGATGQLKSLEASGAGVRYTTILAQLADSTYVETSAPFDVAFGRIEVGLDLGSAKSAATARQISDAQLVIHAAPTVSVSSESSTLEGALPYVHYGIGDTITVPGERGAGASASFSPGGTMKARVLAITVDGSGDVIAAHPEYQQDLSV